MPQTIYGQNELGEKTGEIHAYIMLVTRNYLYGTAYQTPKIAQRSFRAGDGIMIVLASPHCSLSSLDTLCRVNSRKKLSVFPRSHVKYYIFAHTHLSNSARDATFASPILQ